MYPRRKQGKAVYGKVRATRQSDVLWNEAITASPISKQRIHDNPATAEAPPSAKKDGSPDMSLLKSNIEFPEHSDHRQRAERRILVDTDPNAIDSTASRNTRRQPKSEHVKQAISEDISAGVMCNASDQPSIAATRTSKQDFSTVASSSFDAKDRIASPITASTPIKLPSRARQIEITRSHIRFDSSTTKDHASLPETHVHGRSPSSTESDSTADLSSLDSQDVLGDLTDAFKALSTTHNHVPTSTADLSIADDESLHDFQTLLSLCSQDSSECFGSYIDSVLLHSSICKLGEASFSEVYLCEPNHEGTQTVLKVIPFGEGIDEVPINDIIQEVRISNAMSSIPGYIKLKTQKIVQGTYPASLLEQWDRWHAERTSESDRPDWYLETQKYCVISLEHGGVDLEHWKLRSWVQARRLFAQIVSVLAVGEEEREFEHRDLHWGNILVRDALDGEPERITIIDYTLSRALVRDQLSDLAYYGFTDRAIFEAEGDDYQFDIYRLMRDVITNGKEEDATEDWTQFHPSTNVLWLHYLVDKLLYAKGLKKPALRKTKRNPVVDEHEVQAWKSLESIWNLLNPRRKYRYSELPIESATNVKNLIQE